MIRLRTPLLVFIGLTLVWLAEPASAQIPTYDEAWKYCGDLQADYNRRQLPALLERLDSGRMYHRMAAPLGENAVDDPQGKAAWDKYFFPLAKNELAALQPYKTMLVDQIGLLDGRRVAVCVLVSPEGMFSALTLWLERRADGTLAVVDFRGMSQQLENTRRLRQIVLLTTGFFSAALDDEDRIASLSQDAAPQWRDYMNSLGQQKLDAAFAKLQLMPDHFRATRLWQDLADALALAGASSARDHALRIARETGRLNPVLALSPQVSGAVTPEMTLAALDALGRRNLHSPYLRGVRADVLTTYDRAAEGLALAESTYELNPFSTPACAAAVRAANALQNRTAALRALRAWARIVPAQTIDNQLAPDKRFAALRESADYQAWLRESALTSPAGT